MSQGMHACCGCGFLVPLCRWVHTGEIYQVCDEVSCCGSASPAVFLQARSFGCGANANVRATQSKLCRLFTSCKAKGKCSAASDFMVSNYLHSVKSNTQ